MKDKKIVSFQALFQKSFRGFVNNPLLAVPALALLFVMYILSTLSDKVGRTFTSMPVLVSWLVISFIVSFLAISYFFSGLIGLSAKASDKLSVRQSLSYFFSSAKKFWLKNFLIIVFMLVIYQIINLVSIYGVRYLSHFLGLSLLYAQIFFFIVYFAGMIGIMAFLTFSSFILIIKNISLSNSIKESIKIVKSNYFGTLSIIFIFFVVNQILDLSISGFWNGILFELVNSLIIIPYLALVLVRFVIDLR